jgi:hypothetical protein
MEITGKIREGWASVSVMTANRVDPGETEEWMKRKHIYNKVRVREESIMVRVSK